jgi:YgiT-type zinc finger domain-containing protein
MVEKCIKQDFWLRGCLVVIEDVPAGVCPQCGEKVVRAAVGQQIAALVDDARRIRRARTLRVPVLRFAEAGT